jgi:hypothetical protein
MDFFIPNCICPHPVYLNLYCWLVSEALLEA